LNDAHKEQEEHHARSKKSKVKSKRKEGKAKIGRRKRLVSFIARLRGSGGKAGDEIEVPPLPPRISSPETAPALNEDQKISFGNGRAERREGEAKEEQEEEEERDVIGKARLGVPLGLRLNLNLSANVKRLSGLPFDHGVKVVVQGEEEEDGDGQDFSSAFSLD
jgi:hypothetical protein